VGQTTDFLLPKIVEHFRARAPEIELGNLDVVRDFSDVRVVTTVYRRLLERIPAGEVFNVCSGMGCSLSDVLRIMADIAGYQILAKVNPALVRPSEVTRLVGSHEKLTRAIGPIPSVPLADTLKWMYTTAS
jgi:nucleoside-diphosphate-sugar epimerase